MRAAYPEVVTEPPGDQTNPGEYLNHVQACVCDAADVADEHADLPMCRSPLAHVGSYPSTVVTR
jgi:hypothetical protein